MRKFKNILVIIEANSEKQLALQRALEIANFSSDTKITAFLVIYDFSYDLTLLLSKEEQDKMRDSIIQKNSEWLNDKVLKFKSTYPNIESKILWQRNCAEAILNEITSNDYDLVIKSPEEHGFLNSMLFTPLDWQILRMSNIPILIAKEHPWHENSNILVALNFADKSNKYQRLINLKLLRNAQILAKLTKGTIHLVNAAPPLIPTTIIEMPGFSPNLYSEALFNYNKEAITLFAKKHRIEPEHCYVKEGQPDDVIPELASELNACAILIGNAGRDGLTGAIIGNTCEQIIDDTNCDLLVIK
jgi:universal stress protein E